MTYIPFRKHICQILKKLLSIIEENDVTYYPAISSTEGKHCVMNATGKETGLIKKRKRIFLSTD